MFAFLTSGILGSFLGLLTRGLPEVLKYFDKSNERKHELSMFDRQCAFTELTHKSKMEEIQGNHQANIDEGILTAFNSAMDQQTKMVQAAGPGWVASISASVRPFVVYYLLLLYFSTKCAIYWYGFSETVSWADTVIKLWTPEDMSLLSGTLNYYFLDRSLGKRGL